MVTKQVIKDCHVFEALSASDLENIVSISQSREYAAGATIFVEKSTAAELYVIESGKVALQIQLILPKPQLNKKVTVDIVSSNEVLGWSVFVEPHKYTFSAVCLEPTKVLAIDGNKLKELIYGNFRIGYEVLSQIIKVVASRLDETRQLLISERLLSSEPQTL